jgi:glycosyltransferase involved in cell wall biosynthesis
MASASAGAVVPSLCGMDWGCASLIRVGFILHQLTISWMGGVQYFSNLLNALYAQADRQIEVVVFVGEQTDRRILSGFPAVDVITSSMFDDAGPLFLLRRVLRRVFHRDRMLEWLLQMHGIQVLSHAGHLGRHSAIPTIGWVGDLQHLRHPDFFSDTEIKIRDNSLAGLCRYASRVLASSEYELRVLEERDPGCAKNARVLRFVAPSPVVVPVAEDGGGADVGEKYFYLPNQFWAHKNHRAVIEALRLLKASDRPVRVLATGHTADYRHPGFFDSITSSIREADVGGLFTVLGVVPRAEVGRLMRDAVAVINPSLYEGWSTTVEESKSMGKQMILSDIPVHREQAPPDGLYFDPHKPSELAELLWRVWSEYDRGRDQHRMRRAQAEWPRREAEFARRYEALVMELRDESRRTSKL